MTARCWCIGTALFVLLMESTAACGQSASTASTSVPPDSILSLVPSGEVRVRVMELAAPPRLDSLTWQFRQAISRDPAWMQEYVREVNAPPGEPLPYHPNMGLTEEEYQEMQCLFEEMSLVPSRDATLSVTETGEGLLYLDGGPDMAGFSEVVIDIGRATVSTPFGILSNVESVSPSSDQTITGPWTGFSWWHEDLDPETGTGITISFDLGRLVNSGDGLLYYDAKRMEDGALVERVKWMLTYPLSAR